jgi:hypothetical protein
MMSVFCHPLLNGGDRQREEIEASGPDPSLKDESEAAGESTTTNLLVKEKNT